MTIQDKTNDIVLEVQQKINRISKDVNSIIARNLTKDNLVQLNRADEQKLILQRTRVAVMFNLTYYLNVRMKVVGTDYYQTPINN